ncbi:Clp protease ClpP [Paenibacillus sp. J5C_2022]|uniref:head maturation protease, ClpP-related n=1 Tax=Paenibacillus sp. J5C2022 TaxID=2977129 RepID=UPI0021CE5FD7|nr:head maturation protease, ClpP-related [Paenibacillus sp. J5C2022]MCU6709409.1 Clp protease ClpP [Paenibacillus sp. J5C2022]
MEWLNVKNGVEKAELYIYGDIVGSEWDKWTDADTAPEDVLKLLAEIGENKPLDIFVNSGGGSVFAGLAIYNVLKRHKGYKTVHVDGVAASIASVIMLAGDKVIIPANSMTMIHKAWMFTMGNSNDLRKAADDLDRIETAIHAVYEENLQEGVSIDTIKDMMVAETWLNGMEAAQYFKIEVGEANQMAACAKSNYYQNYLRVPDLNVAEIAENKQDDQQIKMEIEKLSLQLQLL